MISKLNPRFKAIAATSIGLSMMTLSSCARKETSVKPLPVAGYSEKVDSMPGIMSTFELPAGNNVSAGVQMVGPSNQIFQANFVNTGNKAVAVATIELSGKRTEYTDTHESNVSRDIFITGIIGVPSSNSVIIFAEASPKNNPKKILFRVQETLPLQTTSNGYTVSCGVQLPQRPRRRVTIINCLKATSVSINSSSGTWAVRSTPIDAAKAQTFGSSQMTVSSLSSSGGFDVLMRR